MRHIVRSTTNRFYYYRLGICNFKMLMVVFFMGIWDVSAHSQPKYIERFGPFDPEIPTPEAFLGYEMGQFHTRHDRIVAYFEALAKYSGRVQLKKYGQTHERRSLITAAISTPEILERQADIRRQHKAQIMPGYEGKQEDLPLILYLGYNIHGNEPSSAEAAMLTAYTLAATQNDSLIAWLRNALIFIDPVINPDGRARHTQWVNSRRSKNLIADKYDTEHNESWPRGRTNHYWFDLNRDLLLAVHPESRARLGIFHEWYPNLYTDFHEMGTSGTYFFEPKRPSALKYPITPEENHGRLNNLFKKAFAREMNRIGDLYYTHEVFDATYPGYGSTYGDLQGGLALLFEQASSRGHIQETPTGTLSFGKTIMHQYLMSMVSIATAVENKSYMQDYQRRYFKEALKDARKEPVKGYIFGDPRDPVRSLEFVKLLQRHAIEIEFAQTDSTHFFVPLEQPQYRLVKHIFQDITEWADSVFYDASAWTLARAYNMPFKAVRITLKGWEKLRDLSGFLPEYEYEKSGFAYIMPWEGYYAPAALNALEEQGIYTRLATKSFRISVGTKQRSFSPGSIIISVSEQSAQMNPEKLFEGIKDVGKRYRVPIYAIGTGLSVCGIDLGSPNAPILEKPKVALLTGEGVNPYEAGEVWYLLDYKMDIDLIKIPLRIFSKVALSRYNVLVMTSGSYKCLYDLDIKRIQKWMRAGHTLILLNNACKWAISNHLVEESLLHKKNNDTQELRKPYATAPGNIGSRQVSGVIMNVEIDTTHPLCFGYHQKELPVYKKTGFWLKPGKNPYAMPAIYAKHPLQSGYISPSNQKQYLSKQPASILISHQGRGKAILFSDDPLFRGTWLGTEKLFLNAILFGSKIRSYSSAKWWNGD